MYVRSRICEESGMLAIKECPRTHLEVFSAAGGAPTVFCDIHARRPTTQRPLDAGAAPSSPGDLGFEPARAQNPTGDAPQGFDGQNPVSDADTSTPSDADLSSPDADLNAPARREYRRDQNATPTEDTGVTLDGDLGGDEGRVLDDNSGGFLPPDGVVEAPR
jgi:hypothetical protein